MNNQYLLCKQPLNLPVSKGREGQWASTIVFLPVRLQVGKRKLPSSSLPGKSPAKGIPLKQIC
jgi:hypothetical protein